MLVLGDFIICFIASALFFVLSFLFLSRYSFKRIKFLNEIKEVFNEIENEVFRRKAMNGIGYLALVFGVIMISMPLATMNLGNIFYHVLFILMTISTLFFMIYMKILSKKLNML